jgi:hypothetical protein
MTSYDPGSLSIPAPEDAVGTPIDSPPTSLPPALFRDPEILAFEYVTDPRAFRGPGGLLLASRFPPGRRAGPA